MKSNRGTKWGIGVPVALVALFLFYEIVVRSLARLDFASLWLSSVGYGQVFGTLTLMSYVTHVGVYIASVAVILLTLRKRKVFNGMLSDAVALDAEHGGGGKALNKLLLWLYAGLTAIVPAVIFDYQTWLVGMHGTAFGYTDWLFHLNASFYVFTLPVYMNALAMATALVLIIGVPSMLDLVDIEPTSSFRRRDGEAKKSPAPVMPRIAVALFLAVLGLHEWLSRYTMTYASSTSSSSSGGSGSSQVIVAGADYYVVHWHLGLTLLTAILFFAGAVAIVTLWKRLSISKALYLSGAPIAFAIVGNLVGGLFVGIPLSHAQQTLEKPYMARTIVATRYAFGVSGVQMTSYPGNTVITPQDLQASQQTLSNIRLADPQAFTTAFSQLQTFRQYYTFPLSDVTVDRYYTKSGNPVEVMLDAREIDQQYAGSGTQQGLLQYTHGYGVIAAGVGSFTSSGLPNLMLSNTPVQGTLPGGIKVTDPSIYYGENTDNPVIAPNALGEFDYPTSQASNMSNYSGPGINFEQHRTLIALANGLGYLFQGEVTPKSKFLIWRNVQTRVEKVAPWLAVDSHPLLIVRKNGQIVWMLDGYTMSDYFPGSQTYSTPFGNVNYLRNSVKIVVNAATGKMTFYAVGNDPIRNAWEKIFPGMIKPLSAMPADIRAHIQYPATLFNTQAQVLERYHISPNNTDTFYAGTDNWSWPTELYQNSGSPIAMPSEQIIAALPGEKHLQFMRVLPFVPPNRPNMVAWMAALEDGSKYGHIVLYDLSNGTLIPGPMQVESEISQNTTISADITLWDQHGSSVIRGDMLEIPIGGGMLTVEPLYIESSQNAMPELSEVIVAYNNQVAMGTTLNGALAQLFGQSVSTAPTSNGGGSTGTPTTTGQKTSVTQIANEIEQVNTQMMQDMRSGNLAQFGQDEQNLETLITELGNALK